VTIPLVLLLSGSFFFQSGTSIQSGTVSQKAESKDCAINVANVTGNVVSSCSGIPPAALEPLNRELRKRRLSEDASRREAESWRQKYESLESELVSAGISGALQEKARALLELGDLAGAATVLDEATKKGDEQINELAATHYLRAKVAELSFDVKTQIDQLGIAYRLAPKAIMIATEYGNVLTGYGRLKEAESVFSGLLEDANTAKVIPMQAATLTNEANSFKFQGRLAEAQDNLLKAASLWELCVKTQPFALTNKATALDGAAEIALLRLHFEEATQLIREALDTEQIALAQETDTARSQLERLNLGHILLSDCDIATESRDFDAASDALTNAIKQAEEISDPTLLHKRQQLLGVAKRSQCLVAAEQQHPMDGLKLCGEAISALSTLEDEEGGKYKGSLAFAYLNQGLVQEDLKMWKSAVESLTKSKALFKEKVDQGQRQYQSNLASAAFYLVAALYYSSGKDAAIEAAREAVVNARELSDPFIQLRQAVLTEAAGLLDESGDHAEAAEYRRELAQLRR